MLLQSQKLESVGILADGVAHEVNNPLSFVSANLAHLQEVASDAQSSLDTIPKELANDLRNMPEVIEDSVAGLERIRGIVQGLLRLSRTPSESRVMCNANEAVLEASRYVSLGHAGSLPVETNLAAELPAVLASSDQLIQVVLNLLLNARRALSEIPDPRVVATTRVRSGFVEIRVADNGPGVPEAIRDKIFDPFFTTGGPDEGTGLGLAIAFDIVREHRGLLELEFSTTGGACFVIRLPVATTE